MSETSKILFSGCAAALVTPFKHDGSIDKETLIALISRQNDMDALVVLGTTGEPCSLTMEEREQILTLAMKHSKIPVIVGTGTNDTRKAIEFAKQANDFGAAAQLCVTPYYNKTSQDGLICHYSAILDSTPLPMILYNVPSRTGMSISAQTVAKLAVHPNVTGIKEASGDLTLAADILASTDGTLPLYCGNDDLILPMMAMGAVGAISVAANLIPMQIRAITKACLSGCLLQAQSAYNAILPLIKALSTQVNPIPIKAALSMTGLIEENLRLPLSQLEHPYRTQLRDVLSQMHLID
ncbi:MAG: 4-hydroxy-tetrahydrodipicolinate synthase [Clostridia bacterium]|nr:4-hydroxy-tetrahydrodipicolinate synthase [Clostridia bacterium]